MPIESITSNPDTLTLTAVGVYPVPVERLWAAWADPRQIERFWGPPGYPATFTRHDMTEGGRSDYHMTGPNGQRTFGCWFFDRVEAPRAFVVRDNFCNADGKVNDALPETRMSMTFEPTERGSRFVAVTTFASLEAMERLAAMGMVEGLTVALAQMDDVVADLRDTQETAELVVEDDTHVVVTRDVRGSMEQVWRAHHEAALLQQWMLGPDGWTMPVCVVATEPGASYRYEWENTADASGRFGFEGELIEAEPPRRAVTTERMIGMDGSGTVNELLLAPRPGGRTRITVRITYPSREVRDIVLGTGMVNGMEASFARLERVVA